MLNLFDIVCSLKLLLYSKLKRIHEIESSLVSPEIVFFPAPGLKEQTEETEI